MLSENLHENKFKRAVVSPFRGLVKALNKKAYISYQYKYITHHKLNWKNPTRYTEKLQYLRYYVYPKTPLVSQCAGRVGVREYLRKRGFEDILIKIYGVFAYSYNSLLRCEFTSFLLLFQCVSKQIHTFVENIIKEYGYDTYSFDIRIGNRRDNSYRPCLSASVRCQAHSRSDEKHG